MESKVSLTDIIVLNKFDSSNISPSLGAGIGTALGGGFDIFRQPEATSEIFIKLEQVLIFLHEKVIYGYVFNWSIA